MILGIIQARMSSIRLPGKSLMLLHGKPLLQWVIEAAQQSKKIDKVIVATSNQIDDKQIVDFASDYVDVFLGDLNNVLNRFYQAALYYKPNHIVRLTADCPLLIPELIDDVINQHMLDGNDYTWNREKWPSGFDVEVFTFDTLCRTYAQATKLYDQEHVTPYIRDNFDMFKIGSYDIGGVGLSGKWSIDTIVDYENVSDAFFLFKGAGK